jgi:hypothetical protein
VRLRYTSRISANTNPGILRMAVLKLHDDGWLKLPAGLQRALGAATGDLLEIVAVEGGLALRTNTAASAKIEAVADEGFRPA